jgi:hypothetical protein
MTGLRTSVLFFLAGCGPPDPVDALLACGDPACRSAALQSAWEADGPRVETWLAALSPDQGRDLLVEQLALAAPREADRLCGLLPAHTQQSSRCTARVVRPHLGPGSGRKRGGEEVAAGSAAGPRSSTLAVPTLPAPRWVAATEAEYGAVLAGCDQPDAALCGRFQARARAADGDAEGAGLACVAADPGRGQVYAECLFQAAEAAAESRHADGFGPALSLCAASSFGPMCVAHVLNLLSPQVPAADAATAEDVAGAMAAVEAIRVATAGHPRVQASYVDWYWACWTGTAWRSAQHVDGRLATLLPAEARPHVAVAVAARLLRDERTAEMAFAPFVARLRAALADQDAPVQRGPPRRGERMLTQVRREGWSEDGVLERSIPAAWVLGPGRRAIAQDDPETDLRIAALEAIAQADDPPPAGFFLALVADTQQPSLVRWTAARLAALVDPRATAGLSDPDPLVQAALGSRLPR